MLKIMYRGIDLVNMKLEEADQQNYYLFKILFGLRFSFHSIRISYIIVLSIWLPWSLLIQGTFNLRNLFIHLFIHTLFNVDNLQLLLKKDKIAIHNTLYGNSCQLQ